MCGRYSLFMEEGSQDIRKIIEEIDHKYPGNPMKKGEIYPTNAAPILSHRKGELCIGISTWGFPRFGTAKGVIINARAETAEERPMFKKSLYNRRCVIPSTGFFEWSQDREKIKYRFNLPGTKDLYLAGIYNEFQGENRFAILTTKANDSIADVHNRMPVILKKEMAEEWILSEDFALSYIHASMPYLQKEVFS